MEFETHCTHLETIISGVGEPLEGNCVYYHNTLQKFLQLQNKQQNLANVAKDVNFPVAKIAEIGFNAGHSALLLLLNAPQASFYFFDLGEHKYTRPCYDYIHSALPTIQKQIHFGDSRTFLPLWLVVNKHQLSTFDVVHVDGGHTVDCVVSDLISGIQMIRKGGIVIVDDTNDKMIAHFFEMWESAGILEKMPQLETPNNTYAHIIARRTMKDF